MTEYSVEKFFDEYALKKEDMIIVVIDSGTNARKVCDLLNEQEKTIKHLTDELFEARKDYIIDTADISDKPYLDEMIEEERKEIYGDVE